MSKFPKLFALSLVNNKLKTFDLSPAKSLGLAYLSGNKMKEIKFDNPHLWNLDLSKNDFETISLDKLPELEQLWLNSNKLTKVDVSKNTKLRVLNVVDNKLKFSTMPLPESNGRKFDKYSYNLQAPIDVQCVNGKVDLSSEAVIAGKPTTYRWFDGKVQSVDGVLQGEELTANDEYTVENGVTTLKLTDTFTKLVCILANENFPNALLNTNYITFTPTDGIDEVKAGEEVKVQFVAGGINVLGARNHTLAVYTIDGKLAYQSKVNTDEQRVSLAPGVYIVRVGNRASKVVIK